MRSLSLLSLLAALAASDAVPYGHPDFYPSPERPLGWRGDGTGAWPGATVVSDWDAAAMRNVAWKVDTPGAGLCQPIIAGEKLFVTGDPNDLYCYNVHDGALLWRTAIDHTEQMPPAERDEARKEQAFWDECWKLYAGWRCRLRDLEKKSPEVDKNLVGAGFQRLGRRLPYASEKQYTAILAAIGDDATTKALFLELQQQGTENGWCKQGGNNGPMLLYDEKKWPLLERYQEAQRKWDVLYHAYNNWLGYVTQSFATPVTDGELVYTTSAHYAVAAVDYSGKVRWLVWEHLPDQVGLLHTRHAASPLLCDGKLVVNFAAHLCVYEAKTGRKLWSVFGPGAVATGTKPKKYYNRGDPEASAPVVGFLPVEGGGSVGVISDGGGRLWRLDDGKFLAKIPGHGYGTQCLLAAQGILLDRDGAYRLVAKSRDMIEVHELWKAEDSALLKFSSVVMGGGKVIGHPCDGKGDASRRRRIPLFELDTGTVTFPFNGKAGFGYQSWISTADHFYAFGGGGDKNELALRLGDDTDGVMDCAVAGIAGGAFATVTSAAIDTRLHGDSEWAILNKTHGWGYQQNSSPSAQANRLFFRCRGVLWCIGSGTFPVPRACPDHARVK